MLLIKLINYLYGYIYFSANGGFPERFVNLCSNNNIFIWNIQTKNDCLYGCMDIKDYKKIRPLAKKSGMTVRINKKVGLPFFIYHNRHRIALPVCALAFSVAVFFLSQFIWTVEVVGNETIPSEEIISAFNEMGIRPGTKKSSVEASAVAEHSLLLIDGITWASLNIKGCNALIEVKEKTTASMQNSNNTIPTNIVSSHSGQIYRIDLYRGTACTKVGSAVEKGDILITGAVTNKDTSVSFHNADAYVSAITSRKNEASTRFFEEKVFYGKTRNRYHIYFFSLTFPINFILNKTENLPVSETSSFLEMNDVKMPVGIISEKFICSENIKTSQDKKKASLESLKKFLYQYRKTFSDKKVIESDEKRISDDRSVGYVGNYSCIEKIGEEKQMEIELDYTEQTENEEQ